MLTPEKKQKIEELFAGPLEGDALQEELNRHGITDDDLDQEENEDWVTKLIRVLKPSQP